MTYKRPKGSGGVRPDAVLGECTEWTGALTGNGYGRQWVVEDGRRVQRRAHRVAWERLLGPIPEGLTVDHLCLNKRCVNVLHMELVTLEENKRRGNARITHCPSGHAYDEANTYYSKTPGRGLRHCRACHRERERLRYHHRKREMAR